MKWWGAWSLIVAFRQIYAQSESNSNSTLLNLAREYRYGTSTVLASPQRASHHYEFVIEKSEGKILGEALFELSELLDITPTLSKKHNAFDLLVRAADEGHQRAQHKLSVVYATGVSHSSLVPMDSSRSLLLEYMSALSGDVEAAMGMGYRLLNGIGVTASCELALPFYELSANHAAEFIETEGYVPFVDRMKLSDALDPSAKWLKQDATLELVEYYANLAENRDQMAALTLGNIYSQGTRLIPRDEDKAIYFYNLAVSGGGGGGGSNNAPSARTHPSVPSASGQLGYLLAKRYTRLVRSRKGDTPLLTEGGEKEVEEVRTNTEGDLSTTSTSTSTTAVSTSRTIIQPPQNIALPSSSSSSFVSSRDPNLNVTRIYELLSFAALRNDPHGGIGMGYLHMRGIGVPGSLVNYTTAMDYFRRFINTHSDAGYYLGEIHMGDNGRNHADINLGNAVQAYTISAQQGNMLAIHRVAQLTQRGMGTVRSCSEAVHNFRLVSERGPWSGAMSRAHKAYMEGRKQESLYLFTSMAALGLEVAQYNAAYILSKLHCPVMMTATPTNNKVNRKGGVRGGAAAEGYNHRFEEDSTNTSNNNSESNKIAYLSPSQWTSAAGDGSRDKNSSTSVTTSSFTTSNRHIQCEQRALLLFALSASQGNAESFLLLGDFYYYGQAGLPPSHVEAAIYYQRAADLKHTQAIFNLGIMHQVGDGVAADLHLAKRYYDLAALEGGGDQQKAGLVRNIALLGLEAHRSLDRLLSHAYLALLLDTLQLGTVQQWGDNMKQIFNVILLYDAQLRSALDNLIASRTEQINSVKTQILLQIEQSVAMVKTALHYDEVVAKIRSVLPAVPDKYNKYQPQNILNNNHNQAPHKERTTSTTPSRSKHGGVQGGVFSSQDVLDQEVDYLVLSVLIFILSVLLLVKYYRHLKRRDAGRRLAHHNAHHNQPPAVVGAAAVEAVQGVGGGAQ